MKVPGVGTLILMLLGFAIVGSGADKYAKSEKHRGPRVVATAVNLTSVTFMMITFYYLLRLNELGPSWQVAMQILLGLQVIGSVYAVYVEFKKK